MRIMYGNPYGNPNNTLEIPTHRTVPLSLTGAEFQRRHDAKEDNSENKVTIMRHFGNPPIFMDINEKIIVARDCVTPKGLVFPKAFWELMVLWGESFIALHTRNHRLLCLTMNYIKPF